MMQITPLQKKLFKTALYSSPVIAAVAITPLLVIIRFHELPPHDLSNIEYVLVGIAIISVRTLFIWIFNILLFTGIRGTQTGVRRSRPIYYLTSYLIILAFILIVQYVFNPVGSGGYDPAVHLLDNTFGYYFWIATGLSINTVVLIIQNLVLTMEKKVAIERENSRLKLRNAEAVNQKMRQQLHPHFLFNSLSTLKTLTKKHPETATDYLIRLSGFLRASLSTSGVNTVTLAEELTLCTDYLEMQKIRFGSTLMYRMEVPDEIRQNGLVPPFSIQLLLENALKHNAMSSESPLQIQIRYEDGWISVSNNKQPRATGEPSTGVGLENLAGRYQMISGEDILIDSGENQFTVCIKVLNEHQKEKTTLKQMFFYQENRGM